MHVVNSSSLVLIRREGHMLETTVVEMLQYVPVEDQVREPTD